MKKPYAAILLLIFIACNAASGQKVYLTANAPFEVEAGKPFSITYSINMKVQNGQPSLCELDKFQVAYGPSTSYKSSTSVVNGETTKSDITTYTYLFIAPEADTLTIPGLTLQVNQKTYGSNPLPIIVLPPKEADK